MSFLKDSEILAERDGWQLVVYDDRAIALISDNGTSIQSPMCCVEDGNDGAITPQGRLIEKLGELYMEQRKLIPAPDRKERDE